MSSKNLNPCHVPLPVIDGGPVAGGPDRAVEERIVETLENRTFDEIEIGERAEIVRTLTEEDIKLFAVMSGDVNPAHLDEEYATSEIFHKVIAHGMWGGALISAVLGTTLPGPGTIYIGQTLKFRRPVGIGDTIRVSVTAASKDDNKKTIVFDCLCTNQDDKPVIDGTATVLAPTEKVRRPRPVLPEVMLHDRGSKLRAIVDKARAFAPVRTAVAHPVHGYSLSAVAEAARAGLIQPVLIGPVDRIRAAADDSDIDISAFEIVPAPYSAESALAAVAMARATEVGAIVMSSHYGTGLMKTAVQRGTGIRTHRRISHAAVVDMPFYPRPLIVTDAYVNTDPGIDEKKDIVINAVELAHALGVEAPKVALVAASFRVENKLRSTVEAAALCKMADRGQVGRAVLEGPLPYDMAVSEAAARRKGIDSPVAGAADIVVCPHLEAGHLLLKQLSGQARAQTAHVVLGARVPIILPSKDDETLPRLASFALVSMLSANHAKAGEEAEGMV